MSAARREMFRKYESEVDFSRNYGRVKAMVTGLLTGDALRAKTMRGGAWLGIGSVAEQAIRFIRNILLARLLAPGAFGTMAIVVSSASVVDTLTDVGLRAAIIQNPRGEEEVYLNASWWLGMGRAIFSYIVIFAIAPWISHFYGRAELAGLLRVALLGILFNGVISPRSALAQRKMKLGHWAAITNGGGICGVILAVALSFFVRDVWALAIGFCSENAFRWLLSYLICPGLPSLGWDRRAVRELLTFSRGIFGLAFLNLIVARADVFVLARLYSSASLGLYTLAVTLVTTPSVFFTNMLAQTLLPALSSVQKDTSRVNGILLEVTSWLILLGLPVGVAIFLCSQSLLTVIYGARYVAAAGPLAVASIVVLITVINAMTTGVLFAKGRPELHRQAVAASAATMILAIYPAIRFWGLIGGQIAGLLSIAVGYLLQVFYLRAITGLNLFRYGSIFVPPTLGSAAMLGIVLGSRFLGLALKPVTDIALCLGSGAVVSAVCVLAHLRALRRREEFYSLRTSESAAAFKSCPDLALGPVSTPIETAGNSYRHSASN